MDSRIADSVEKLPHSATRKIRSIDKDVRSRYKKRYLPLYAEQNAPAAFGTWLNLPPPGDERVGPAVKYRCTLLLLLYWGILSAVRQQETMWWKLAPPSHPG